MAIKSDSTRERVPKRFLEKRPKNQRPEFPGTPEPQLGTDPTYAGAPFVGPTPQLISSETNMPDNYVHTPGNYQTQRMWRDSEMQPDAFDTAITECHADALKSSRGVDGIPADMEFVGYEWQLQRSGDGTLWNVIFANYAPSGTVEEPADADVLKSSNEAWHPQNPSQGGARRSVSSADKDADKRDKQRDSGNNEQRQREQAQREQEERERQQRQHNEEQMRQPQPQPGQPGYVPPGNPGQQPNPTP
jgi:hypothetical protein